MLDFLFLCTFTVHFYLVYNLRFSVSSSKATSPHPSHQSLQSTMIEKAPTNPSKLSLAWVFIRACIAPFQVPPVPPLLTAP